MRRYCGRRLHTPIIVIDCSRVVTDEVTHVVPKHAPAGSGSSRLTSARAWPVVEGNGAVFEVRAEDCLSS